ncbi:hypothetical protein D3C78_1224710 [compost metagenome]
MTRLFDFALLSHSVGTAKTSYQLQLEKMQQFSIDASIPFNQVFGMQSHIIYDYYKKGAWNIKKAENERHDQMQKNIQQLLVNAVQHLRNIR